MIRPFTLITMMLAMLSGAYLFAVKHRAQVLDDQLASVADQTRLDEQRIRVLQAQWSLEIDPSRLSSLAHRFTSLQPMQPAQLTTLTSLASLLPPPGSAAPGNNPVAPMPVLPPAPATIANTAPVALPQPPAAAPAMVHLARATVSHSASQHPQLLAAREIRHIHTHKAGSQFAENIPPRPVHAFMPMGAQLVSVRATAPADAGSALAMGADLAPPQPLPGGANN